MSELKIMKKQDGYWLRIEVKDRKALIHLHPIPRTMVAAIVEEAYTESETKSHLTDEDAATLFKICGINPDAEFGNKESFELIDFINSLKGDNNG